ncbi:hypothetical protein AYO39_01785 [Actinobacteria bacterium SCGC AG-212-D09]|nr:hypothetical protein AYO39_01785 [Actinobacteria bacterium SCGC AG-212-D09]
MLDNFEVLRRPQNSVDRSWQPNCGCGGAARQLSALTRYVGKAGGYGIYLDVEQLIAPGQLNLSAGSYLLNVDAVDRRANNVSSTSFGPNTGFTVPPFEPYCNVWVGVVPDGVATVSWAFVCRAAEMRNGFCGRTGSQTVTVPAINNIAARHVTVLGGCRRTVGRPLASRAARRSTRCASRGEAPTGTSSQVSRALGTYPRRRSSRAVGGTAFSEHSVRPSWQTRSSVKSGDRPKTRSPAPSDRLPT